MYNIKQNRWDKVYKDFKGNRFSVWKESSTPFFKDKIQFLKSNGVRSILDAGCGDGRNLLAFAEAGFEIMGMDSSREACERSERISNKYPKVKVKCQDLYEINNKSEFDAIICDYVLVHLEDGKNIIQKFYNALKKNGYLVVEFLSTDDPSCGEGKRIDKNSFVSKEIFHKFYSVEEVKKLLSCFELLEISKINHDDPDHVEDYPRSKRHKHDSIYVLCKKV